MSTWWSKKAPIFVDTAQSDEYLCSVCLDVMHQPVQVGCSSGHMYCEQCIKDCINAAPPASLCVTCPLCNESFHQHSIVPIPYIQRKINDLAVKCPNHSASQSQNHNTNHNVNNNNHNDEIISVILSIAAAATTTSSPSEATATDTNTTEHKESSNECADAVDENQEDEDSKKENADDDDHDNNDNDDDDDEDDDDDVDAINGRKDNKALQPLRRSKRLQHKASPANQEEKDENAKQESSKLCGRKRPRTAIANTENNNSSNHKDDDNEETEDEDLVILNDHIPLKKLKLDPSLSFAATSNTPSSSQQCAWTGRYGDFAQHLNECEFERVSCKFANVGCTELVERRLLTLHAKNCVYAPIKCPLCNHTRISKGYLEKHVLHDCIMMDCHCSLCGMIVKRKDLKFHTKNECTERLVECEFKRFGCCDVKKKDIKTHNQENMQLHLKLVAKSHRKLEVQVSDLSMRLNQMEQRYGYSRNGPMHANMNHSVLQPYRPIMPPVMPAFRGDCPMPPSSMWS